MSLNRMPTTIDINQIISWYSNGELVIKPIYQRNRVWKEPARSYLIDSIMKDYPIPPIFMRDKLNLSERKTNREVIDGQQRISTILDYYNDNFVVRRSHNQEIGGKKFSELTEDQQERFLTYKIYLEKITEKDDSVIFDMFARLNCNSIPLNAQELRNAKYSGEFKVAAYDLAISFRDLFSDYSVFSATRLSRMEDVEFISVLMLEFDKGITEIKTGVINKYYENNNENYPCYDKVKEYLVKAKEFAQSIYNCLEGRNNKFFAPIYLYDLITWYRIYVFEKSDLTNINFEKIATALNNLNWAIENIKDNPLGEELLNNELKNFIEHHITHSTGKVQKEKRVEFLNEWLSKTI